MSKLLTKVRVGDSVRLKHLNGELSASHFTVKSINKLTFTLEREDGLQVYVDKVDGQAINAGYQFSWFME